MSSVPQREHFYCAFPYLDAEDDSLQFGPLVLQHKRKVMSTENTEGRLLEVMDLFRFHTGKPIKAGFYATLSYADWEGPHRDVALRAIVDFIRYSILRPDQFVSPDLSYTDFYTIYLAFESDIGPVFAGWRNFDQWMPPSVGADERFDLPMPPQVVAGRRLIYPPFQLMHPSLRLPEDVSEEIAFLESLFDDSLEFEGDKDIINQLLLAIRWYNASFKDVPGVSGSPLVYMATAFETLFDSPAGNIQAALAHDLRFLFFDNRYVQDWIKQFYDARSRIVHRGYAPSVRFRVGNEEHLDLVYWARVIFRICVRTLLHQRREVATSEVVHAFVPNSKRLQRIAGILRSQDISFPEKLAWTPLLKEIENLHLTSFDHGSEKNYPDISFIGRTLLTEFIESAPSDSAVIDLAECIVGEEDWSSTPEGRSRVCELYGQLEQLLMVEIGQSESLDELRKAILQYARYAKNLQYVDG